MLKKILIASGNSHKISEIISVLKDFKNLELLSLKDFGVSVDVIEDGKTLNDNAFKKAKEIYGIFKIPTISDDTGLFVDALNGEPGVYSARYAGEHASYSDNCKKLIENLKNHSLEKRTARFESVICFYVNDNEYYLFNGICEGKIIFDGRGEKGFGYDSLFVPDGLDLTFAEMSDEEKNKISHRGRALQEFKMSICENHSQRGQSFIYS
ncbi:MAG: RdgB/HAM1 family non-canonical purine NTP pyrophosphatase [Ignavibacteria bacterium]